MNTEQPSRNQNYVPLCTLGCGSLLPLFFVWSLFRVRQGASKLAAQASLRTPKKNQECWSFAKSFSAASASQRTTPMILSRRQFSKTLFAAPFVLRAQQEPLRAHVKIDTERVIGDIDPKIYGNFIEHLGRCIDGGVL